MTMVSVFVCPSDPYTSAAPLGVQSYRTNAGICFDCDHNEGGAFSVFGSGRVSDIRDGLSHTLAFSEKPVASLGSYSPIRDWLSDSISPLPTTADGWIDVCSNQSNPGAARFDAGRCWLMGGTTYSHFFVAVPPNSPVPDCGNPANFGTGIFAARSYHPGGVNALTADGSVHWFASTTDRNLWRALGTRSGGEIVP